MRTWRWYSKVLLGLLILAFAYYVWPTPWRYDMTRGSQSIPFRINRFTGDAEMIIPH